MVDDKRSTLRKHLRHTRRSLSPAQQHHAAQQLPKAVINQGLLNKHQKIAFYWPNDGEVDPSLLLTEAHKLNHHCYLPVLTTANSLDFFRYHPGDELKNNRFGIPEPVNRLQHCNPWELDLVFLPLVGFDRQGGRLGMGGGFYDRTFDITLNNLESSRPRLIGLAHSCQEIDSLPVESWDVPLSDIITEEEVIAVNVK